MPNRRYGRLPRRLDALAASTLHYSALRATRAIALPPLHQEVHNDNLPEHLGDKLNDVLGDCVPAGLYTGAQVWTMNSSGVLLPVSNDMVIDFYEKAAGYDPAQRRADGSNPTDNGTNEQTALALGTGTGLLMPDGTRSRFWTWIEVDPRNKQDVCEVVQECEFVLIGFAVPTLLPEDAGSVWGGPNMGTDTGEGHCVICTGYAHPSTPTMDVRSWGDKFTMLPDFWDQYVDEVYGIASPLMVKADGRTPFGLDPATLEAVMQVSKGVPT